LSVIRRAHHVSVAGEEGEDEVPHHEGNGLEALRDVAAHFEHVREHFFDLIG
jgi:hypothetical protein